MVRTRTMRRGGVKSVAGPLAPGLVVVIQIVLLAVGAVPRLVAAEGAVLAQYVLMADASLAGRTTALARAILAQPSTACPAITLSDGSPAIPMQVRPNPNPAAFGVMVCEAEVVLPAAGVTATIAGQITPLPVPPPGPFKVQRLAVLGDSGCKGGEAQPCAADDDTPAGWPLPKIAAAAAAGALDLVIHVGDYNYSGTPNKTGAGEWSYDGCVSADGGPLVHQSTYDTWETWDHDFFTPAAPLLAAAPWVMVRGNHELCSRAGQGWFYFLDPHSKVLDPYVAPPGCDAPSAFTEPYRLSFANLDLVVLDTANACGDEDPESASGRAYEVARYRLQLNAVNALLATSDHPAWLLGHRPIWSLYQSDANASPSTENRTLQEALAVTPGGLSPQVALVLSGHMHQFFSLTFQGARPPQLVIGNSGVVLSANGLPSPYAIKVDGMEAAGLSVTEGTSYGYLEAVVRDGGHWTGTVKAFDAAGTAQTIPVASCGLPLHAGRMCRPGRRE